MADAAAAPKKGGVLKKVLIGVAAVVAVFLIVVALQPNDFRVERSATIAAPPATVFALVNDLHRWEAWSPWEKLDPAMKRTHEGAASGTGAVYAWAGNDKVGEGRMTITESRPPESLTLKLDFLKPFESTSRTDFSFKPQGAGTFVTWTMTGQNNFIGKMFCMFMNMDKMVGGDFERGLASLNAAATQK